MASWLNFCNPISLKIQGLAGLIKISAVFIGLEPP